MKFRIAGFLIFLAIILSGCNFSLAEDITPPSDYKSPTPAPTLSALVPPAPPSLDSGAAIYADKCAPCHGERGLGDGPQAAKLEVPVPAIGLADISRHADPGEWYAIVTQGRMQKFMPPFSSLSDQQRWDVLAYVYSLSVTPDQLNEGKALFEAECASCHGADGTKVAKSNFVDPGFAAKRAPNTIMMAVASGVSDMPAFSKFTDEQLWSLAVYVRSLSLESAVAATSSSTPQSPTATPNPNATPAATVEAAVAGSGSVSGSIVSGSGVNIPLNQPVVLRVYEHQQNQTAAPAPVQVDEFNTTADATGAFIFENIKFVEGRFYDVETTYSGVTYQSPYAVAGADTTNIALEPITVYDTTDDYSALSVDKVHIGFNFPTENTIQIFNIYILTNPGDKTVVVHGDNSNIPFITIPDGATDVGYEDAKLGGTYVTANGGFGIPPGNAQYGIVAYYTLPYNKKVDVSQSFKLPVKSVILFSPNGIKIKSDALKESGVQDIQGFSYQTYSAESLKPGDILKLSISGTQNSTAKPLTSFNTNTALLIGASVLGIAFIIVGVWLYLRDRKQILNPEVDEEIEEVAVYETAEEIMDAIIVLDDQFRAGNITQEAYQKRRDELKEKLKEKL
jgi:mono/diheme cytochrome c family protein